MDFFLNGLCLLGFLVFALLQMPFIRDYIIAATNSVVGKEIDSTYWSLSLIGWSYYFFAIGFICLCVIIWINSKSSFLFLSNSKTLLTGKFKFGFIVLVAVLLRLVVMSLGHNFDFESYLIVGEIVNSGGNVYAETPRYNYGPIFSFFQGFFYYISSFFTNQTLMFRIFMVCFLTGFDIVLALFLYKKYRSLSIAAIFLLNPISIIITGYHNQFDNIAVFLGYLGCLFINDKSESFTKNDILAIVLLSLSLITKHLLFVFPLWILFKTNLTIRKRVVYGTVPVLLFLLSFAPYLNNGFSGIVNNVFLYKSFNNFPLIHMFIKGLHIEKFYTLIFIFLMVSLGYLTRKMLLKDQILYYFLGLICFSSAITNQYLAIPVLSICILGGAYKHVYFTIIGFFIILHWDGLNLGVLYENNPVVSFYSGKGYIIAAWVIFILLLYRLLKPIKHDGYNNA